jgi:O-antigen/teichoic acid export membrane protein
MKKDYIYTLAVMVSVMVTVALLFKFAQSKFGSQGFAELSLTRRIISFLAPTLSLGMGVGLPREVARVNGTNEDEQKYMILRNSVLIKLFLMSCFFILVTIFSDKLANLLFASKQYSYLLLPMGAYLLGVLLNGTAFSYFRGLNRFGVANSLQAINLVLSPLVIIIYLSNDIAAYLSIWGWVTSLVSIFFLWPHIFRRSRPWREEKLQIRFISYSVRRLPGDISLQLMFVIPPIITAHMLDFQASGNVAFSITLLTLAMMPLSPVSTLLLPNVVDFVKQRKIDVLERCSGRILLYVGGFYCAVSAFLFLCVTPIMLFYLPGKKDLDFFMIETITIVIVPYSIYTYLRSFIDAMADKAYNSINCFFSLLVFVTGTLLFGLFASGTIPIAFGLICGFYTLGILTYWRVRIETNRLAGIIV